jgi:hypothetical protein
MPRPRLTRQVRCFDLTRGTRKNLGSALPGRTQVVCFVHHDAQQPRSKRAACAEPFQRQERVRERFLRRILCLLTIGEDNVSGRKGLVLITAAPGRYTRLHRRDVRAEQDRYRFGSAAPLAVPRNATRERSRVPSFASCMSLTENKSSFTLCVRILVDLYVAFVLHTELFSADRI